MKRKKLNKKLRLNKETIANMDGIQMNDVKGGLSMGSICCPDTYTCPPFTVNPPWGCQYSSEPDCTDALACTGPGDCTVDPNVCLSGATTCDPQLCG